MKTLAVFVVAVFIASPLAGVVILFSRIPTADLAAGFLALAAAASIALVVVAVGWAASRVIEAYQPKPDIHAQIDARRQYAIDARHQTAAMDAPQEQPATKPVSATVRVRTQPWDTWA